VDPFEAQFASPQLRSVVLAEEASGGIGMSSHGAVDPFEVRFLPPHLRAAILAQGMERTAGIGALGDVDPFETQFVPSPLRPPIVGEGVESPDVPATGVAPEPEPVETGSGHSQPEYR
jgi:hypothetical protein